jgi:hypothetical protein
VKISASSLMAGVLLSVWAASANSSLIGEVVTARILENGAVIDEVTEVVLSGPEATGNWFGEISYDLEAASITISSLLSSPQNPNAFWRELLAFEFFGLESSELFHDSLIGARVSSATGAGWSLIDDSDLIFSGDSLLINAGKIGSAPVALDQRLLISLQVEHQVSAPATLALMGFALAVLAWLRPRC